MSVTEIPILDPKNIIVRGHGDHPTEFYIFDPVAKLSLVTGRLWQQRLDQFDTCTRPVLECWIAYAPDYTRELFTEPMRQEQWDCIDKLGVGIGGDSCIQIARRSLELTVKNKRALYVVRARGFVGIGIPNEDIGSDTAPYRDHVGDPKYKFWPDGTIKQDFHAAQYYLHMMFAHQSANFPYRHQNSSEEFITNFGVAIDRALADFIGLGTFPNAEQIDDDLILVLKGTIPELRCQFTKYT
jgi:hypothetical protein